ncbi:MULTISPECIES: DUF2975 domain-containing protein [Flavobacteriaceae]|uniref:DUF2975 domain-containing protein n=2 Tax=Flavobacteriaceae TaxID=49546 RepID=A0A4Y8ASN6_9FLAO|nr:MULTISPECIES: DUF2975 domain-containing protein [Flavobacteriaceae]TEW73656.1 DUF2975 domain-containing protein [Gramella jeungdoensis]GGK36457.1 hypothetical protein GCM10007963_00700 [Lutibacter litoralis]
MRKLNILKALVDLLWFFSMISVVAMLVIMVIVFFDIGLGDFDFNINGVQIEILDYGTKFLSLILVVSYLIVIYCLYLFRVVLKYFYRLKVFDEVVLKNFNKIGYLLITAAFLTGVTSTIYKVYYMSKVTVAFNFTFSPFVLLVCLGLFFMVLSEIFGISKKLKEENELTI